MFTTNNKQTLTLKEITKVKIAAKEWYNLYKEIKL